MTTFHALGVPDRVTERLTAAGIHEPFPIQAAVIPDALAGRDVLGRAPTGGGKTLAFGIPLVTRIPAAAKRRPTGLVLAPTRELAEQIAVELRPLAKAMDRRVVSVYGGVSYGPQRAALSRGTDLVLACPGRLEDLLATGALVLDDVRFVVVDEADRMADMGFLPALTRIVTATRSSRQTILLSATLDGAVSRFSAEVQRDPVEHRLGPEGPDMAAAEHHFWKVPHSERVDLAAGVVERMGSTIIFSRTRRGADRIAQKLEDSGVSAAAIHGARSQRQRDSALRQFTRRSVQALVATDVAARGIHVDDVAAVIHFDPPEDAAAYVHRSGRTARAGATGTVVSFIEPRGVRNARALQRQIGIQVDPSGPQLDALTRPMPGEDSERTPRPARAARAERQDTPEGPRASDRPERKPRRDTAPRGRGADRKPQRDTPARRGDTTHGIVKSFDSRRGYGFILHDGGQDLFVHHSNIAAAGFRQLEKGQRVSFEIGPGRKGVEALNVSVVTRAAARSRGS